MYTSPCPASSGGWAPDHHRDTAVLQAGEFKEVPEEVPVCTYSQVPLTQCPERSHLLDAVRVEVLEL
jgi:hypothetical protein